MMDINQVSIKLKKSKSNSMLTDENSDNNIEY